MSACEQCVRETTDLGLWAGKMICAECFRAWLERDEVSHAENG